MRLKLLVLTLLLALSVPFAAHALEFGARAYYWNLALGADINAKGGSDSTIDFKDQLGLDDKGVPTVEGYFGLGSHHITVGYAPINNTGDQKLGSTIKFNGVTFASGTKVESTLDVTMIDGIYHWDLIDVENILAGFSFGPEIQVKYVSGEAGVKGGGKDEKKEFTGAVPMVGLGAHVGILAGFLEARVRAAGIGYSGNTIIDGLAEIAITPFPFMDLGLGYRMIKVDAEFEDTTMDVNYSGPFLSLGIGW